MTHMAQGVGSGMGASKGQGWAHRTLVWVSMVMFVLWALSVSWVHAKPKAPPSPLPQVTQLGQGTLVLKQGASGVLQATLSPTPTAPGVLAVSSDAPATASVPATITFAAGQTQVGIPVTGEQKGKADVTVSLNGSSRSAKVNVTPSPSRLLSLSPAQATLQPGATLVLQVSLTPRKPGSPVTLQLSSSDPAKVFVPASITLAEGQSAASFEARAMSTGSATITARLNQGGAQGGTNSVATAQIQVVPTTQAPLTVVSLAPPTSSIEQGAQTTLTLTLSAAASTPTTVALQARSAGVLSLPTQVVVPTGQSSASFPVQGLATGQTLVVASLGNTSAQAAVQVTPVPARVASLEPTQTQLTVNAQATLTARLNAAQPTDTRVALSTQPPGVAQVSAEVLVPAGQTQATLAVTALAVGQAEVVASLNGSTQRAGITVTPEPVKVAALLPQPLGIQEGASGALTVRLGYDAKGQLSSVTLPAKTTTSTLPVVSEGQSSSIAKAARQIALSYNAAGDLSKITDALNNATNLGTDPLGRTTSSTDPLGYAYSPYGESQTIGPDATGNPIQYTSRENDGTGLYFYRARHYDPVLKRFVSRDPIGLEGGLNVFRYADGGPTLFSDPTGLIVEVCERPIDISWIPGSISKNALPYHQWLKTDVQEAGMGAACLIPGQGCSDRPLERTFTKDHGKQSTEANSSCKVVENIDEDCVNSLIKPGQYQGRWTPLNQCQSFVKSVIESCKKK